MENDFQQFQVKHEQFEGPIEVLLELIEKRKLFVNDVSLAAVTDDFISFIQNRGMHPDLAANFLAIAATLILIKARSLLPTLELTTEESDSISDLERRLALYQIISHISGELIKQFGKHLLYEGVRVKSGPIFAPDPVLTINDLKDFIVGVVERTPKASATKPEARVSITISIGEVIDTLIDRISTMAQASFSKLQISAPDGDEKTQKVYTIVSFLGMLELVRRGLVNADQNDQFGDIQLAKHSNT